MAVTVVPRTELVCRLHDAPVSVAAVAFVGDSARWAPVCRDCLSDFDPADDLLVVYLDHGLQSGSISADNH
jgi:hypothetical protein